MKFFLALAVGTILLFQNCAPTHFNAENNNRDLASNSAEAKVLSCEPSNRPFSKEEIKCPAGSIGIVSRTRMVTCTPGSNQWSTGAWVSNYSQCDCSGIGQFIDAASGTCVCPKGQELFNGVCRPDVCDPTTQGPLTQTKSCPTNSSGTYTETRTATCNRSTYQYTYSNWSANFSTCTCAVPGQTFSLTALTCQCPNGQVLKDKKCITPPLCPLPAPANLETMTCPSGVGTASRSRTVTCAPGATNWNIVNGTWNFSACGCPVSGAQLNLGTGQCSCPAGTYDIAGRCGTCGPHEKYNPTNKSCERNVFSSTGQHCDIGGDWGWRSNKTKCQPGTLPVSASAVGGCPEGFAAYNYNGKVGCYISNRDPRRPPECYNSDPADECCIWLCSPAGEASVWTCRDRVLEGDGGGTSAIRTCTDQFGHIETKYVSY